jgi:hypothetical protein
MHAAAEATLSSAQFLLQFDSFRRYSRNVKEVSGSPLGALAGGEKDCISQLRGVRYILGQLRTHELKWKFHFSKIIAMAPIHCSTLQFH